MTDYPFDKLDVANSFSRAAQTYDQAAGLQRDIAKRLLDLVDQTQRLQTQQSISPESSLHRASHHTRPTILDLGCGTGFGAHQLLSQFPEWQYMGLDIAQGMLSFAKQHHSLQRGDWLCGDAERLPFASNSLQFIYSGFALQWCLDINQSFQEIYRSLQKSGLFAFSIPLSGTLDEIKRAWQNVDTYVHVNEFHDHLNITNWLEEQNFVMLHASQHTMIEYFDSFRDVAYSLKTIGAHNLNKSRANTLMGRNKLKQLVSGYEVFRGENGKLPLTYQVGLYVCQKR